MKRFYAVVALLLSATQVLYAVQEPDTAKVNKLNEVVVKAVQVSKDAPFAVAKINKAELNEFSRSGRELPFLLSRTPGVTAWSENGLGTGTVYMRMRGAGDSRINVTLDGVALNSPEDQCVFWANMNSYSSFLGNVQIQRGVGTSTNGDGAFGGSISLQTLAPSYDPTAEFNVSGGSYGTYNVGGSFSTGLTGIKLKKHYLVLDGAYHHTGTNGFIHGTDGNSGSYYGALTFINEKGNFKLSYKHIGNYERTGQAWNGVLAGDDWNSLNESDGVKSYADLYALGLGRYNILYETLAYNDDGTLAYNDDGTIRTKRYTMADGSLWGRTTDNFWQNHNLLNATWQINDKWSTSATLHYTRGHGYYDELKVDSKLAKYGLTRRPEAGYDFVRSSDFVRQKGLVQNTYGLVWNANYKNDKWDVITGISVQNFQGNHYGYLTYCKDADVAAYYMANGKYQYYDSDARKLDMQMFAKATYHINSQWDVYGDVQYRHVAFKTWGLNDRYVTPDKGYTIIPHYLDVDQKYNFCNPKAGLSWHQGGHNAYASYALSHREPERNNFTNNGHDNIPQSESVHDVELGYSYNARNWYVAMNLYMMQYHNQLVQTGELSDIGEALTTNIKSSNRMGVELSMGYSPTKWLSLEANAAISRNKIQDYDEFASVNFDEDYMWVHYDNSTLAYSPTAVLNGFVTFTHKGFKAVWHTNFVSRQYMDNTASVDRSLPRYSATDIRLSYDWKVGSKCLKNIIFGLDMNNIFNRRYAANGFVWYNTIYDAADPASRYNELTYMPMAGFTAMGSVAFKF